MRTEITSWRGTSGCGPTYLLAADRPIDWLMDRLRRYLANGLMEKLT